MSIVARNSGAELSLASAVDARVKTVIEADVHRVDVVSCRSSRRVQSASNSSSPPPPAKTSHRCTTARTSPRHSRLSDLREADDDGERFSGVQIGRTSSNVETLSSTRAAMSARRVRSCDYDGRTTSTSVAERLRQLPRVRAPRATPRCKPAVVLVPPPAPGRPSSDKVPRYNDTGSFEEVDERLLMLEGCCRDCCSSSVPAAGTSSDGRSSSVVESVVTAQYRKLWDLRATLEQTEDLSDDSQTELAAGRQIRADETAPGGRERTTNIAPSFLPLPSDVRRYTYQHAAVERRLRQPAAASWDRPTATSVDSVETDGDASDTSRHDVTTTSFESSTTTTTTTTDNTDAGDGRPLSTRSPRSAPLPAASVGSLDDEAAEASDAVGRGRPPSSSSARDNCSDVADAAEPPTTRVDLDSAAGCPGVAASLRSAARKRRDFRNERSSVHRFALDRDDLQSSTDQPSGDSVDGGCSLSPGGGTSTAAAAMPADRHHPARYGPSNALRRFLSYKLSSQSSLTRSFRCRHHRSRDYRSVISGSLETSTQDN